MLALVWAIIQIQVLVGVLAGVALGSTEAARTGDSRLRLRALFKFDRRQFVQCLVMLVAAALLVLIVTKLFAWIDAHALEVASFLTFRSERPVSPHTIERVWGWNYVGDSRTVDVHVRWLREKIELDPAKPIRIITVRGAGYRFEG